MAEVGTWPTTFTAAAEAAGDIEMLQNVVLACIRALQSQSLHSARLIEDLEKSWISLLATLAQAKELTSSRDPIVEAQAPVQALGVAIRFRNELAEMQHLIAVEDKLLKVKDSNIIDNELLLLSDIRIRATSLLQELYKNWTSLVSFVLHADSSLIKASTCFENGNADGVQSESQHSSTFNAKERGLIERRILAFLKGYRKNEKYFYKVICLAKAEMGLHEVEMYCNVI